MKPRKKPYTARPVTKAEEKALRTLSGFGKKLLDMLEAEPKVTAAYRSLFGPEHGPDQIIQTALERYNVDGE